MGLHVSWYEDSIAHIGGTMDYHYDWKTWLHEGLADSVTAKSVWRGSRLGQELLSITRELGIRTFYAPYIINYFSTYGSKTRRPGGEKPVEGMIKMAREFGYDGFQIYEVAAIVQATADGRITMPEPALRNILQREFARR